MSSKRWYAFPVLGVKGESEGSSRLSSQPVESVSVWEDEDLKPDMCNRSKVESDRLSSTTKSLLRMSSSVQRDESDSLSWVHADSESCSRPQSESVPPLSSVLDVSDRDTPSNRLMQSHTFAQVKLSYKQEGRSAQLQQAEAGSVNWGGGGMISAAEVFSFSADLSQSISCTHRPRMMGGSSPSSWLCLALVFLRCFLWSWQCGGLVAIIKSSSSVSLTTSFPRDLQLRGLIDQLTEMNHFYMTCRVEVFIHKVIVKVIFLCAVKLRSALYQVKYTGLYVDYT